MNSKIEQALTQFQQSIEGWQPSKGESAKVYTSDRKQMMEVLVLCRRGQWAGAYDKARSMDTILRDNIPDALWDAICDKGGDA